MNTLPLDPYGNSKLIIPRSNSTSDLFNVGNFIPSCTVNTPTSNSNNPNINNKTNTNTNHLRRNHSINYSSMTNNNININNYNGRSADQPTRQYQYKKRFDQVNNNIPLNNTNNNNLQYTNGQTLRRSNTTISRSNSYNNNNNNSNNIRRSNTGNYQNSSIVPSKNSNDLHKYVVQNNMVRRSNTLNPNIPQQQQQQQQQNQAERVKRSNTQNYSNIFNVNTNNPRRNNTINVSSSTGQRNYPNINTFRNFEQYYNQPRSTNNNNTRVKELSPLQIQRNKMKSEFTFPNGERFTPRQDEKVNTSIPPPTPAMTHTSFQPFQSSTSNTSNQSQPSRVNIPTENQTLKRSNSKKFGSFWKKIMGKESKDERLPKIQITPVQPKPEPLSNQPQSKPTPSAPSHLGDSASSLPMLMAISSADQQDFDSSKLIERLQHQWEIIHQDSSISQTTQDSIIESYLPKTNVSFSNEIFVNETYSSQEYDRADPEEVTPVKDRKLVFDNEFGFIDEVKYGLNQYKRNEMMIHKDSIKYVQFCK